MSPADWSQLPQSVLVKILGLVPTDHRFSCCSLVSTSWAEAVAVATRGIKVTDLDETGTDKQQSLEQYLDKHGQHITALWYEREVHNTQPAFTQLSCPNLQQLQLDEVAVQMLPGSSGQPGLLHAATGLTSLSLATPKQTPGFAPSLSVLTSLPSLQDLGIVVQADGYDILETPPGAAETMPSETLRHLQHLTSLRLLGGFGLDSLHPVSCLSRLHDLWVDLGFSIPDPAVAPSTAQQDQQVQLPPLQQLTYLRLATPGLSISSKTYPWLAELPSLRELDLADGVLDAGLLSSMRSVQQLSIMGAKVAAGSTGMVQLLRGIGGMQSLGSLTLHDLSEPILSAEACGGLTSSSKLRTLDLSGLHLPDGGWQCMFPAGQKLHALCDVRFNNIEGDYIMLSADLQAFVQCCPNISRLALLDSILHGESLEPLMRLTGLDHLTITGVDDHPNSIGALAQLPALRELIIDPLANGPGLLAEHVLQLTRLTRSTRLRVDCTYIWDTHSMNLANEAASGSPPDVWYQLLLRCTIFPECQPLLLEQEDTVLQRVQEAGLDSRLVSAAIKVARARVGLQLAEEEFTDLVGELHRAR